MDNNPFTYTVTVNDGSATVRNNEGTLYALGCDLNECLDRFVEQILYPCKKLHPFDWSVWPEEHKRHLKSAMRRKKLKHEDELITLKGWLETQ